MVGRTREPCELSARLVGGPGAKDAPATALGLGDGAPPVDDLSHGARAARPAARVANLESKLSDPVAGAVGSLEVASGASILPLAKKGLGFLGSLLPVPFEQRLEAE